MAAAALPTVFINHGGGPCFFMPDDGSGPFPANTWRKMASNLSQLAKLPGPNAPKVKAILVASAHWETEAPAVTVAANPPLLYDYYGFPPETYEIEWLAPGDPDLAQRVSRTTAQALDHGLVPFEAIVDRLNPHRDPLRIPFFDVTCTTVEPGYARRRRTASTAKPTHPCRPRPWLPKPAPISTRPSTPCRNSR